MIATYFFLKFLFFFSLVRSLIRFDPLRNHVLFLGVLYTAGVAFLSAAFLLSREPVVDWHGWEVWLGKTLVLATVYFWLLVRFEEGILFWVLLPAGVAVVLF
jgi:hypothetical protein